MELLTLIQRDAFMRFAVLLPISGGMGNSIENPVVIGKTKNPDLTAAFVSDKFLKTVFLGRDVEFAFLKQELLAHNGKMIDRITYIVELNNAAGHIKQEESFYFDISAYA